MLRNLVRTIWLTSAPLIVVAIAPFNPASGQSLSRDAPGQLNTSFDSMTDLLMFEESGWRAMSKGWYDSAEREFTAAIKIAKRPSLGDLRLLARMYSSLAWALQNQGRNAEAEPLARWALETREQKFGPNAEPVAKSLNQMATLHLALNRPSQAEPLLRRVIAMDRGTSRTLALEQAQAASLLGLSLVSQRRYAEGETEFSRAIGIRAVVQGADHPETGDELNNLAWAQLEQGKLNEARRAMSKSLMILEPSRGGGDPSVARALDGLARMDTEQRDFGSAEERYRRSIAIYEKLGAGQEDRLKDDLKRYADLLDRMSRPADAAQIRARFAAVGVPRSPAGTSDANANANASPNPTRPKYPIAPVPTPRSRS